MGLKFFDYDGLQPKITPPKHFSRQCNTLALPFLLSNDLLNSVKQEIYVNVARLALRGRTFTTLTNFESFLTTYNPFVEIFYPKRC